MIVEPQTPSLLRRMACWLYEGMLIFGVMFIADYLFSTLTQTRHAMDNRHAQQFFLFVVFGIYFVWFWSRGQTLAMKTWHIRVTDLKGGALSQQRALWRYTLSWLWFLPPLLAGSFFGPFFHAYTPGGSSCMTLWRARAWLAFIKHLSNLSEHP
jgi:uncharacterized RDD family membrane protein YckC